MFETQAVVFLGAVQYEIILRYAMESNGLIGICPSCLRGTENIYRNILTEVIRIKGESKDISPDSFLGRRVIAELSKTPFFEEYYCDYCDPLF